MASDFNDFVSRFLENFCNFSLTLNDILLIFYRFTALNNKKFSKLQLTNSNTLT